jgi:hypothetical protein
LEDDLDPPSQRPEPAHVLGREVLAVEEHAASRRLLEPQDAKRRRRLPAAALPDEGHRLAALDVERDAVHGVQNGAPPSDANAVLLRKVLDSQDGAAHAASSPNCSA